MPKVGWEGRLKRCAKALDNRLKQEPMQTIIHGDCKSANMMFAKDGQPLLYDFQYCGKAPPTKDLAYFIVVASAGGPGCTGLVDSYYLELTRQLKSRGITTPTRAAVDVALDLSYCDLGRWMSGWGWWGHDLQHKIEGVLGRLDGGQILSSEAAYGEALAREFPVLPSA